jgi:hypothetical protein
MKKILVIVILLISTQSIVIAQTNYIPLGTWKYISGNDTLEVFFVAGQITAGSNTYPIVRGYHKYIKNGVLLENSLSQINNPSLNKASIVINYVNSSETRFDGIIKDLSKNRKRRIILKKINLTQISVSITSYESWQRYPVPTGNGYTLPRQFTLIKQ